MPHFISNPLKSGYTLLLTIFISIVTIYNSLTYYRNQQTKSLKNYITRYEQIINKDTKGIL